MHVPVTTNNRRNPESGAALILVAVAMIFLGIFMTLGLGVFETKEQPDFVRITHENGELLIDQLASFTQEYGRLPCPASNAGAGSSAFGLENRNNGTGNCNSLTGIVPFRALGLQEADVLDGWGHYFTYAASPVFTNLDHINDNGPGTTVYDMCRRANLWVSDGHRTLLPADGNGGQGGGDNSGVMRNLNPRKAKFCCPDDAAPFAVPGTDLQVTGSPDFPLNRNVGADRGNIDTADGIAGVAANSSSEAFAVVLVSHGEDGSGAFTGNGGTLPLPAVASANETENADGDNTFADGARILTSGPNYFDDILFYRTNWSLFAELNSATCTRPFR